MPTMTTSADRCGFIIGSQQREISETIMKAYVAVDRPKNRPSTLPSRGARDHPDDSDYYFRRVCSTMDTEWIWTTAGDWP